MNRRAPRRTVAPLLALGAGLGAATVALAARALTVAGTVTSPAAGVEDWVELVVVAGAALAAAWVALGALLGLAVVVSAQAGRRWHAGETAVRAVAPALVGRLVRAGVGIGVGAGLALSPTAALAAAPAPGPAVTVVAEAEAEAEIQAVPATGGVRAGVDLSWRPTAPTDDAVVPAPVPESPAAVTPATPEAAAPAASTAPPAAPTPAVAAPAPPVPTAAVPVSRPLTPPGADGTVVVLRGDTLWDIAARWIGGEPSDAQVLAATARWHEANRSVIGDDADVILPGQILTPPA